jgi:general secretion pathway protein L
MSQRFLIRFHAAGGTEWVGLARDGSIESGPFAGLPKPDGREVVVIVPAEQVVRLAAPRLAGSRQQLAQALPFAIEEQLATPVEQLHLVFCDGADPTRVELAVVARADLQRWFDELGSAGLVADSIVADAWLLPSTPDLLTLLLEDDHAMLRGGDRIALAASGSELPSLLELAAAQTGSRSLHVLDAAGGRPGASLAATVDLEGWRIERRERVPDALVWLAARLHAAPALNLLQGDFAPPVRGNTSSRLLRVAGAGLAAAILLTFATALIERVQLQRQVEAQRAEMERILREALPGVTTVVDPRAQLAIELQRRQRGGGDGALVLLSKVAPIIAGSGRYTIDGLDYRAGTLEITLRAPDVATLDSLREALAAVPPLRVELTAATPGQGSVEGRLRIRGGAA